MMSRSQPRPGRSTSLAPDASSAPRSGSAPSSASGSTGTGTGEVAPAPPPPDDAPGNPRRCNDVASVSGADGFASAGSVGGATESPGLWRRRAARCYPRDPRGGAFRRFREQTYDVFRPAPTLPGALAILAVVFVVGLGLGVPLLVASLRVVELRLRYDDAPPLAAAGSRLERQRVLWAAGDAGVAQTLHTTVPRAMYPPLYLLYELPGFFATHKRYIRSASWEQLAGRPVGPGDLSRCEPALYLGGHPNVSLPSSGLVNPCGLRAAAFFNDTYTLEADPATCGNADLAHDSGEDSSTKGGSGSTPRQVKAGTYSFGSEL
ncbi:hypothetical protein GPECTOR_6g711 [Gonium pectorale]|uniref:Uncharacterized protein n=1 Tax=Gonium pectorale TaxID=33097 RepID=A0A150GVK6_GONPE|nr:hypothetical protein GPECTOR_6g711 [Gonium pectorale]|eukprot:KXZ53793.1 hypothetical protein GPECTOR_6g711 [Gonium pectorale]